MTKLLLAAGAALAAICVTTPASAQDRRGDYDAGFSHHRDGAGRCGVSAMRGGYTGRTGGYYRCGRGDVVMDWYGGEWALYNNRSWDSDSYNDWWHDRPDRAYPRWVSHNEGCARMWYSGDTLHC